MISVQIVSGTLLVGNNPFGRCWGIAEIEADAENTYLKVMDGALFYVQDKRLVSYTPAHASYLYSVPDRILHIGNYAFSCAENLREICLPASIITIGRGGVL